jgi:hypothetical protein
MSDFKKELAMTTDQKTLFEGALKLPRKMKVRLAEKLLTSLDDNELELEAAILEGAKLAHKRIQACLEGKEKAVSEEEILALLEKRK